jgi:signal transduction histidine kinase
VVHGAPLACAVHHARPAPPPGECCTRTRTAPVRHRADVLVHRSGARTPVMWSATPLAGGGVLLELREPTGPRTQEHLPRRESDAGRIAESEAHRAKLAQFTDFVCHEIRNPLHGMPRSPG